MGEATPQLRVGDRERREVDDRLMAAVGDGVLTLGEYDERSGALWQARTRAELDALVADLPGEPAPAPAPAGRGSAPGRVVAVLSEDRFAGALVPGQEVTGLALLGKAVLDLRRDDLPDGTRVTVRSVLGEAEVLVPPGSVVHLTGLSLLGERTVEVVEGSGPVVHVEAVAVLGTVKVGVGDGTVVATGSRRTTGAPARRATSVAVPRAPEPERRGGRVGRLLGRAGGLLVPVAVLGAVLLAGPDSASVFGSSVERVSGDNADVAVSTLFGSVTVVVPDGSDVDTSGLVVFGSTDGDVACSADCTGGLIRVRALGAFGSVDVVTESQYRERQAEDERQERQEEIEEQRD